MIRIEEQTFNLVHYLACEYDVSLNDISDIVAEDIYKICDKINTVLKINDKNNGSNNNGRI